MAQLSDFLTNHRHAKGENAQERIRIAMARLPNVLERQIIAHTKTLEQKISDQGPYSQRVDPHLLGLAIHELHEERHIIRGHTHDATKKTLWYANAKLTPEEIMPTLDTLAPLYAQITTQAFPSFVGDALEVVVFKALQVLNKKYPRYSFDGAFDLDAPRRRDGRYRKIEPQQVVSGHRTTKRMDFILHGFDSGPIGIECKNLREWMYPSAARVTALIRKAIEMQVTPLLIARRIHYTTIRNFLEPAGILAHESYYQYYPAEHRDLADQVKHKRSLGFSDIRASNEPEPRTLKFFIEDLPKVADHAATRFRQNTDALIEYVEGTINLAQLYTAIGSPAGGKWNEFTDTQREEDF